MPKRVPHAVDGVHKLRDPFEGEELALNGDQYGIRGDESVQREKVKGWRAVDQDEVVLGARLIEFAPQPAFAVGQFHQFNVGCHEVSIRGDDSKAVAEGSPQNLRNWRVGDESVIGGELIRFFGDTQAGRCVSLWVNVDQENAEIIGGERRGQVDGGCSLSDAALLVCDGDYFCHGGEVFGKPYASTLGFGVAGGFTWNVDL